MNTDQLSFVLILDGYEGPIDLLLSLAREQKVDLSKITILPLAEQYLDFINTAKDLNIDLAADYLVMASWLTYLKSRLLLPVDETQQDDDALELADALKHHLMRLEAMQNASKKLMALPRLGQERFYNRQAQPGSISENVTFSSSLFDLLQAYGNITSQHEASTFTVVASKLFSVEEAVQRLQHLLAFTPGWSTLESLMPGGLKTSIDHRSAMASHFVASLELAKDGIVKIRQEDSFAPIWITQQTGGTNHDQ